MHCKITNSQLSPFMTFGKMPIANGFLEKENFNKEFFFDLEVGFSEKCSLFQLNEHPTPDQMFNQNYPFFTGSSEFMKIHFKKYSDFIKKKYLKNNSNIIEIGSNDGTFLSNFKDSNLNYVGFEPSKNVADLANKKGIKTINNFFNIESLELIKNFIGNTSAVFAANVICHIPELNNLIKTLDKLLAKDGVFIFEEPYLGSMFEKTSYDQIYDEHIFIFSDIALEAKTTINQLSFNIDARLDNKELEKKEMNYSLDYSEGLQLNLNYNETNSQAFKNISSDTQSLGVILGKKINNNIEISMSSNLNLKDDYSPLKQSLNISLFDECSRLDISYVDERFNDNYNMKPSETISVSFHMDYLGFFGYEQKSNLFFDQPGNFNYGL